jgi:hypothetical protein
VRLTGSTLLNHPARKRTHAAMANGVVSPANVASTISVKINATL